MLSTLDVFVKLNVLTDDSPTHFEGVVVGVDNVLLFEHKDTLNGWRLATEPVSGTLRLMGV